MGIFRTIGDDIRAIRERDAACTSNINALLNYPGLHALWAHRLNHRIHTAGLKTLARFGSQVTRWFTGIEIHPGAQIGQRFFIDHGMGVVIGETTIIGDDVTLYQGVTLGGTGKETGKRHPTLEDGVIVGVGASVLGAITVGEQSKVGGGAVVIEDVPPHSTVVGIPGRVVVQRGERVSDSADRHEHLPDPVAEMLRCMVRRLETVEAQLREQTAGELGSASVPPQAAVEPECEIKIEESCENL